MILGQVGKCQWHQEPFDYFKNLKPQGFPSLWLFLMITWRETALKAIDCSDD